MHEHHVAKRGLANRSAINEYPVLCVDRLTKADSEFGQKIVWVLPVDERLAVQRFARLEEVRTPALSIRDRICGKHQVKAQSSAGRVALSHPHEHGIRIALF